MALVRSGLALPHSLSRSLIAMRSPGLGAIRWSIDWKWRRLIERSRSCSVVASYLDLRSLFGMDPRATVYRFHPRPDTSLSTPLSHNHESHHDHEPHHGRIPVRLHEESANSSRGCHGGATETSTFKSTCLSVSGACQRRRAVADQCFTASSKTAALTLTETFPEFGGTSLQPPAVKVRSRCAPRHRQI